MGLQDPAPSASTTRDTGTTGTGWSCRLPLPARLGFYLPDTNKLVEICVYKTSATLPFTATFGIFPFLQFPLVYIHCCIF